MKPAFSRRYRRRSKPSRLEGTFFKKESQDTFFSGPEHDNFFQPVVNKGVPQTVQKSGEEENKAQRTEEKKEEKVNRAEDKKEEKVMKMEEKKEEEKVQKKEEKKEEEKVMKMEEKKEEEKVHKKEAGATAGGGKSLSNYIGSLSSKGQSLPAKTNEYFSSRMGYDFSDVKVHTDKEAAETAREINAKAYTVGNNIVFNEGQCNEDSGDGKKLLAHELTHVMQQDKSGNHMKEK